MSDSSAPNPPTRIGEDRPSLMAQGTLSHVPVPGISTDGATGAFVLLAEVEPGTLPLPAKGMLPAIPGYEVLGILGRGGMGIVYKARQIKANRIVALKMILAGSHAHESEVTRFHSEAEAIARLQHPHIVQVFDVNEYEGQPFFSLEFCGGGSLAKQLHGAPLPAREAARLVEILAAAVHAAHQKGIIHRDLKPANVLLASGVASLGALTQPRSPGERGRVSAPRDATPLADWVPKITDFGLAKKVDDAGQTASGAIMGTPSYMAPEQASGDTHHIGPAADIYALGAILYETLTGRPPFRGTTPVDTVLQVLHNEPVPPRQLQPRTPRDVETICLKCLQKDASRRYATAEALAADLGRFLRGEPIEARPVGWTERAAKWVRRRPAMASLLAVAAALPLMALLLAGWYLDRQQEFNRGLQAERNKAVGQKELAERNQVEAERRKREADEQRDEADSQRKRAQDAYRDSQLRLMQMHVSRGVRLMEDGDSFAALPWLVAALQEDPRDAATKEMHRYRIGAILRQSPKLTRIFFHPASMVKHVEFSPDGSKLLTTCDDHVARIWDVVGNKQICSMRHIQIPWINRMRMFSPDGRCVFAVGLDHKVHVADAATGKTIRTIATSEEANWFRVSSDGKRLFVVRGERCGRVWDVRTGKAVTPVLKHDDQILDACFSPNGRWIATASKDAMVRVWDAATGKAVTPPLQHDRKAAQHVIFSPDGQCVATTSSDARLRLWQVSEGSARLVWEESNGGTRGELLFRPDGSRLVSCSIPTQLWNAKTGARINRLPHDATVYYAAFSPNGRWLTTCSEDKTARVWDAATGVPVMPFLKHTDVVLEAAFSPDGRYLATGCWDGAARIWDLGGTKSFRLWSNSGQLQHLSPDTRHALSWDPSHHHLLLLDSTSGKVMQTWRLNADVNYAGFSPDNRLVIVACADKTVRLWDLTSEKERGSPLQHDNDLLIATVSPDVTRLAAGCKDGTIHVWDLSTHKELYPPLRHADSLLSIRFSADGRRLLTAGKDSKARVWDAATGQPLGPFVVHHPGERTLWIPNTDSPAWSPDGKFLVTRISGFTARASDVTTGQPIGPPLKHSGGLGNLLFRPDGSRVLSVSNDCTALQWDIRTGKRLTPAMRHGSFVRYGTYSPDGRRIATTEDSAVRVWDAATGLPLTPPLRNAKGGHDVRFSPDGRRLFQWFYNQWHMYVWDVSRDDRPIEDLVKLTNLLAGHQLDANGGMIPLTHDELSKLWHDLGAKYPQDFSISPTVVLRWAQSAEARGQYSQAIAYYDQLIALGGKNLGVVWPKRANAFAQLQQWDKTLADFEQLRRQKPEDHYVWFQIAPLLLRLGDWEGYRRHCQEMLQRFGQTRNQGIAEHIAKGCLLHSGAAEEIDRAADLMAWAIRDSENHPQRDYFKVTMGLAEYRQRQFHEAEQRLDPFLQAHGKLHWSIIAPGYLVLAMAQQRQGHIEKARETLKQATRLMDQQIPRLADAQGNWLDWLVCQLLREEAEDLLKEKR